MQLCLGHSLYSVYYTQTHTHTHIYTLYIYVHTHIDCWSRDNSVGTATRYVLDGPGIESRWGTRFSASVQTGPGAHPASCTMGAVSFPGVKRPEHPSTSSAEDKERVELYLYSSSGPLWPVLG